MAGKPVTQPWRCETCNVNVNSQHQYVAHLEGKSHMKKLVAANLKAGSPPKTKSLSPLTSSLTGASDEIQSDIEPDIFCLPKPGSKRKAGMYFCAVCDLGFNSEDQASCHFSGFKHSKKLKTVACMNHALKTAIIPPLSPPPPPPSAVVPQSRLPLPPPPETPSSGSSGSGFFCSFCNVDLNSTEQLTQHRYGSKHQRKVKLKTKASKISPRPLQRDSSMVAHTKPFTCNTCCMSMNNAADYKKHNNSPEHWKRLKELTGIDGEYMDIEQQEHFLNILS